MLAQAQAELREQELISEVVKPAEAEALRRQIIAEAEAKALTGDRNALNEKLSAAGEFDAQMAPRILRDALPVLEDGEYYHADLIGCEVIGQQGARLGTVVAVDDHGRRHGTPARGLCQGQGHAAGCQ